MEMFFTYTGCISYVGIWLSGNSLPSFVPFSASLSWLFQRQFCYFIPLYDITLIKALVTDFAEKEQFILLEKVLSRFSSC